MTAGLFEERCQGCGKVMMVDEVLAGCLIYCEDCPFPIESCETCGQQDCNGECCQCKYCVERRSRP